MTLSLKSISIDSLNYLSPLKMVLDKDWKIEEHFFPKNFFYRHSKVVSPDLIGCYLIKRNNNKDLIKGIIVETEAYSQEEESCHGYRKITESNKSLFGEPGTFYIYKSYGIHFCLNIVTDREHFASGVLIRSVFIPKKNERLASGPGLVTKTFGIDMSFNSLKVFNNNSLWLTKRDSMLGEKDLIQTTRIGISKAKNIKWRWYLKNSRSVSKRLKGDRTPKLNNHLSSLA